MASFTAAKPGRSGAKSLSSRGYSCSRTPFVSSSASCVSRSSSSAVPSVRVQNDQRSASPGRSISSRERNTSSKKACMCSPTNHPGSYRCALHKNSSNNSVNAGNRTQFQNRTPNNILRRAMANSIARIGGVGGGDLLKVLLSALIKPPSSSSSSSHQQQRRIRFQARPSRLSTMSKA